MAFVVRMYLMYANTIVKSKPETAKLFPANNFFDDEHCCDALVFIDIKNMERENFVAINDDVAYCRWKKAIPSMMHISEKTILDSVSVLISMNPSLFIIIGNLSKVVLFVLFVCMMTICTL